MHAHFLYGVDDGAQTREEMERMLDAAYADGIRRLYATPHVTPGIYPIENEVFAVRLQEAQHYCEGKRYDMEIFPGAEILYTPAIYRYAEENPLPTLGGSNLLLIEFTPTISLSELKQAVKELTRMGYAVVLAHIERYRCMYFGNAFWLKRRLDVAFQVNTSTVIHAGRTLRDWEIRQWFRRGLISYVSSDAHNCSSRPFKMKAAYPRLLEWVGERYAARLTGLRRKSRKTKK